MFIIKMYKPNPIKYQIKINGTIAIISRDQKFCSKIYYTKRYLYCKVYRSTFEVMKISNLLCNFFILQNKRVITVINNKKYN